MSEVHDDVKKIYKSADMDVPIIEVSSPVIGSFVASILSHAEAINKESIKEAKADALLLAFEKDGKPLRKAVARHRESVSSEKNTAQKGPYIAQPGSVNTKFLRAWRAVGNSTNGSRRWDTTAEPTWRRAVIGAFSERVRYRTHNLFMAKTRYHPYVLRGPHVIWPNTNFAIVSDAPKHILVNNNGQTHSTDDLAVKFSDGWGVAFMNGITIPSRFVLKPESLTLELIQKNTNVEVKRCLIELFGYARWLRESKAKLISEDKDQAGKPRKLWRLDTPPESPPSWITGTQREQWIEDNSLNVLEVFNSTPEPDGTFKKYFLQVGGHTRTPVQALNNLLHAEQQWYAPPRIET